MITGAGEVLGCISQDTSSCLRFIPANPNRTLWLGDPGGAASGGIGDEESAIMDGDRNFRVLHPGRAGGVLSA